MTFIFIYLYNSLRTRVKPLESMRLWDSKGSFSNRSNHGGHNNNNQKDHNTNTTANKPFPMRSPLALHSTKPRITPALIRFRFCLVVVDSFLISILDPSIDFERAVSVIGLQCAIPVAGL